MRATLILGLGVLCLAGLTGCANMEGTYAPGPQTDQVAEVPTPLGTFKLPGERDTNVHIVGLQWLPGAGGPSAELIDVTRSASGPIGQRGDSQALLEHQRYVDSIASLRAVAEELRTTVSMLAPMVAQYRAQSAELHPVEPSISDKLLERLDRLLAVMEK